MGYQAAPIQGRLVTRHGEVIGGDHTRAMNRASSLTSECRRRQRAVRSYLRISRRCKSRTFGSRTAVHTLQCFQDSRLPSYIKADLVFDRLSYRRYITYADIRQDATAIANRYHELETVTDHVPHHSLHSNMMKHAIVTEYLKRKTRSYLSWNTSLLDLHWIRSYGCLDV
jgi:hypothetical protein